MYLAVECSRRAGYSLIFNLKLCCIRSAHSNLLTAQTDQSQSYNVGFHKRIRIHVKCCMFYEIQFHWKYYFLRSRCSILSVSDSLDIDIKT